MTPVPTATARPASRRSRSLLLAWLLAAVGTLAVQAAEMPRLVRGENRVDLIVDGRPWLVLGGELRNSSSSTLGFMEPIWPHLEALHLNTVFTPVSWRQLEPAEGQFDFALVDGLVRRARQSRLRLILLWMGTWKNGVSGYAPGWVLTQPQRFPRLSEAALSPFGEETAAADARAFQRLLAHLREIDREHSTVLMIQVENEIGTAADRSPLAQEALAAPVPAALIAHLVAHASELKPYLRERWGAQGRKTSGTWADVFGPGPATEDIFMAWHYATFVGRVAAAGKAAYPLPMYVNACQLRGDQFDATHDPFGGPTAPVLDVWMAAAPAIEVFAVDNYRDFKPQSAAYRHRGNPLFIPESCIWWKDDPYSGPAKALYAIGEHDALAFSTFGIDNETYRGHLLGDVYRELAGLTPLILPLRGTGRMHGFYHSEEAKSETFAFHGYRAVVTYRALPPRGDEAAPVKDRYGSFGLILQTGEDEFMVLARGADIRFESTDPARTRLVNLGVEEVEFADGRWKMRRLLSGDEVGGQGAACVLTPPPFSRQAVVGEKPITVLRLRMARLAAPEKDAAR
ncbi:MAG: DUF5597 domain-containing protein [Verrucomicrobia bacterium]|nr:DUF5597 domain-containing protein [Verrucomicrobiota bacterium]